MTALTIIKDACGRIGVQQPQAIFSSQDEQVIQMRSILNEAGKKLARAFDWRSITKETSFTTVAASVQTSAIPSDFDHYIKDTMFNRTQSRKVFGPLSASEWQLDKAGFSGITIENVFRFRGSDILMTPNPTAGESVYYEYVSKYWCQSLDETEKAAMTADDDTAILDEELLTKDLIWRFLKAKSLDYAEAFNDFQVELAMAKGRDGSNRTLSLSREYDPSVMVNVPEGNWTL